MDTESLFPFSPGPVSSVVPLTTPPTLAFAASLLALLAPAAVGLPAEGAVPLRVDGDATWTGDMEAPDGLVVANGTRLTLQGATLRLGGLLDIEPGATLSLQPSEGRPARIVG